MLVHLELGEKSLIYSTLLGGCGDGTHDRMVAAGGLNDESLLFICGDDRTNRHQKSRHRTQTSR